jgi:hypothetical protein
MAIYLSTYRPLNIEIFLIWKPINTKKVQYTSILIYLNYALTGRIPGSITDGVGYKIYHRATTLNLDYIKMNCFETLFAKGTLVAQKGERAFYLITLLNYS